MEPTHHTVSNLTSLPRLASARRVGEHPSNDDADDDAASASPPNRPRRTEATVSVRVIRALVDMVEQSGGSREAMLHAAGLTEDALAADDGRMNRSATHTAVEMAMQLTGDPALGLHWAERLTESSFPPITNLFIHSTSLGDALEALGRFFRLLSDGTQYEVVEEADRVIVRRMGDLEAPPAVRRFIAEMFTVGLLNQIRRVTADAKPAEVWFEHAEPAYRDEYDRVFDRVARFDQPFTGIVFDRQVMSVTSPYKDDEMQEVLRSMAERRLMRITRRAPYAHRVREVLVGEAWPHRTDMQSVARALRISVRSLRRRLAAEGTPYGEVLNEALAIIAKQLLRDESRSIQDVSDAMGFTDKSTFHRAFKRWTGTTPNEYRRTTLGRP
ncbi:MAG: AraC family transcriptional regulator [Polyangiales bacterium]